ncbi:MAG: nucleoside-diphosphate kinase [bacterium]|nr:nucleoside-diphosphate kinase [bacterium]
MEFGMERTLVLIKPDALEKNCADEILNRFLTNTFEIAAVKKITATPLLIDRHYQKKFLEAPDVRNDVVAYITSGPIVALILKRPDAIAGARLIIGPLHKAPKGTIRGDFPTDVLRNLAHGSDSPEAAEHEIAVWFGDTEKQEKFSQLNPAERLFILTEIFQKEGLCESAVTVAAHCLRELKEVNSYEETASGHVVKYTGHIICLPDFLHSETAQKRFAEMGIQSPIH